MKILLTALAIMAATTGVSIASVPSNSDDTIITKQSTGSGVYEEARRKKRVPGGSGCDDPGDTAEHPECRG